MADRVLGLYGPGRGPTIPTMGRQTHGKVVGDPKGIAVEYHVHGDTGIEVLRAHEEGVVDLPLGQAVHVEYHGKATNVLCFVGMR